MTVAIRAARASDADAIAELHAASWRIAYRGMLRDEFLDGPVFEDRRALWRDHFADPKTNHCVLLAEHDSGLIAFACAHGAEDARFGTLLDNLHVASHWQGHGVGRLLMHAIAQWSARSYPRAGMFLWVLEGNVPARRFYERLGARLEESVLCEPPGGGSVAYLRYVWPSLEPLLACR
jgi:GNAT superfamily N-acetyltransferase